MQVQSIKLYALTKNFRGSSRLYNDSLLRFETDTNGEISTYTTLFRDDMNWQELVKILEDNFKNKTKVNMYSLACSDGSEAYTMILSLLTKSLKPEKFFPIKAIDRDKDIIDFASKYRINLSTNEIYSLENNMIEKDTYFFNKQERIIIPNEQRNFQEEFSYSLADVLKNNVQFVQGDILETIKNIKDEGNTVILCRNVFPYLSVEYHYQVIEKLLENLKPGSFFIIGQYDLQAIFHQKLEKFGFEKVRQFVYKRV